MLNTDMGSLSKTLSLLIFSCLSLVCPLASQGLEAELQIAIDAKRAELVTARLGDLQPVTVNGVRIDPILMKRELIHLVGNKHVEGKISEFFLDEHLQLAIESGRDPSEFIVTEDEVKLQLGAFIAEARKQNPDIKFWDAIRSGFGMEKEAFMEQNRQSRLFDKIFFPGSPKEWPAVTQEAIRAQSAPEGGGGSPFWEGTLAQIGDQPMPPFLLNMCRQWVLLQLHQWSEVLYPAHGLPPETCLRVNSMDWSTEEAFELIKPGIFAQDLDRAVMEVVISEVLRQELLANDAYLDDEEFKTKFAEYRAIFDESMFPLAQIVTTYKGYPGLEAYRRRWRLIQSYAKMIEDEITDRALTQYGKKHLRFFRNASTNVDLIPFLAVDASSGAWAPNGLEKAYERADVAMKEIETGADFVEILESRGEFFNNDEERGRLGTKGYNQLRQGIFESEYSDLLHGYSLGYFIYFDAEVGKVYGPMRGPKAWYLLRVNSRVPMAGAPDLSIPSQHTLVEQDYIVYRFQRWANEMIDKADIR